MSVEIKPIEPRHIEGFHGVLDVVARERGYLAFLEAPPIEAVRAFILDNIERGYPQLVALSQAGVIGWCDITSRTNRPVHAHIGVLGMGLLPAFRGQRIGTKLMDAALAEARKFGFHRIELTVRENNRPAIALYRAAGFGIEGVQRDGVRIDGRYENVLMMALLF